jgi:tetratricopeptide (TPR) repeat protein
MIKRAAAVVLTAAALLLLSGAFGFKFSGYQAEPANTKDPLTLYIERSQQRLRDVPGDWQTWAGLGSSYVEVARVTGDPTQYQRAEAALTKSQTLHPNDAALTGLGALANARHDFAAAEGLARQALTANPHSATAYGVLVDALTQLGRADEATEAVQRMLDLDPGLPALSRAAYDLEQHGRVDEARALWHRALADAHGTNAKFVHQQLGDLAWHDGDLAAAQAEYQLAGHRLGLARVSAQRGETDAALALYSALSAAQPSISLLAEYSTLLRQHGRTAEADIQLTLADAALAVLAASGGSDNLAAAEVAIARGDFGSAVRFCEQEWTLRTHSDVADLLGWSLHLAGQDTKALVYAQKAVALGTRNRDYHAHLRAIQESLT